MQNEILEYLYNNEGHTYNDILQYFIDKFPNANQSNLTYAKEVIASLIDKKLISLENDNYNFLNEYVDFQDMKDRAHETGKTGINGRITFEGKTFIENKRRNEKQDELNASFKKLNEETTPNNNRTQRRLTRTIAGATIAYTLISGIQLFKGCEKIGEKDNCKQKSTQCCQPLKDILKNNQNLSDSPVQKKFPLDTSKKK